jgi:DNA-binding response OmpR family regulator
VRGVPAEILVIDDDPNIRETLGIHLRNAGFQVCAAKDGIEGGHAVLERCAVTRASRPSR